MLSQCDYINDDKSIRVLRVIDDISFLIKDKNVENISVEMNNNEVGSMRLICLEKSCSQETKYEDMKVCTLRGKKVLIW